MSEEISLNSYKSTVMKFIDTPINKKEKILEIYKEKYTMEVCALAYLHLYQTRIDN